MKIKRLPRTVLGQKPVDARYWLRLVRYIAWRTRAASVGECEAYVFTLIYMPNKAYFERKSGFTSLGLNWISRMARQGLSASNGIPYSVAEWVQKHNALPDTDWQTADGVYRARAAWINKALKRL